MSSSSLPPTFTQSLLAGALAGTAVDLLFFPLDTLKTRLQAAQGFVAAGGVRGVYQGVGSVVVGGAPGGLVALWRVVGMVVIDPLVPRRVFQFLNRTLISHPAAVFFAVYDTLKQHTPLSPSLAPLTHILAASIAEVAACTIRVPTEVIKTRSQTAAPGSRSLSLSLDAARLTLAADGLAGFYRGFGITVAREIPFTSIQFPLYELFKSHLARRLPRNRSPDLDPDSSYSHTRPPPPLLHAHEAALCGSLAGAIAAFVTTPLDVLKTRVMLDTGHSPLRTHLATLLTAGPRTLFAGALPRTLWISAGGAVFLGVYEWGVGLLR
ncbi:mitochondrial carrier [Ramaria rubella]|nr:mitochondrial carrier [Ramaria rubella]